MNSRGQLALAAIVSLLWIGVAAGVEQASQAAGPVPVVVYKSAFPISLGGSEYQMLSIVQDFPPGSGSGSHKHGGYVLVTVLGGELTLRENGRERVVKIGDSWTEQPGAVHSVVNAGKATARVAASFLLPKGAEITTMVK